MELVQRVKRLVKLIDEKPGRALGWLVLAGMAFMLMWGAFKSPIKFHVDEVWQYSYSNSGGLGTEPFSQENLGQWMSPEVFRDYIMVQPGEGFNYGGVIESSKKDVHPPLTHFVLHTVCSFFPNQFSKWFGLGINIVCYGLTIVAVYWLGMSLFGSARRALAAAGLWAFSSGAVDTVMYIRMYCPLTLVAVVAIWLTVRFIQTGAGRFLVLTYGAFIVGGLTDYIFWILGFFMTLAFVLIYWRRQLKRAVQYAGTTFAAFVSACLIYPNALLQFVRDDSVSKATASTYDLALIVWTFLDVRHVVGRFLTHSSERVWLLVPGELYFVLGLAVLAGLLALVGVFLVSLWSVVMHREGSTGDFDDPARMSEQMLGQIWRAMPAAGRIFVGHAGRALRGMWGWMWSNRATLFVALAIIMTTYTLAALFPEFDIWTMRGFFLVFPFCSTLFAAILFALHHRARVPVRVIVVVLAVLMVRSYGVYTSPFLFRDGYEKLVKRVENKSVVVVLDHVNSIGRLANLSIPLARAREVFVLPITMDDYREEVLRALDSAAADSELMVINMSGGWPENEYAISILGPELLLTQDEELVEKLLTNGYTGRPVKRLAELFQWFSLYEVIRMDGEPEV